MTFIKGCKTFFPTKAICNGPERHRNWALKQLAEEFGMYVDLN